MTFVSDQSIIPPVRLAALPTAARCDLCLEQSRDQAAPSLQGSSGSSSAKRIGDAVPRTSTNSARERIASGSSSPSHRREGSSTRFARRGNRPSRSPQPSSVLRLAGRSCRALAGSIGEIGFLQGGQVWARRILPLRPRASDQRGFGQAPPSSAHGKGLASVATASRPGRQAPWPGRLGLQWRRFQPHVARAVGGGFSLVQAGKRMHPPSARSAGSDPPARHRQ